MSSGKEIAKSTDPFDIIDVESREVESSRLPTVRGDDIIQRVVDNPVTLLKAFDLTEDQAENIASVVAGSGAGLGYKYLNKYFGSEISAMIGAGVGAYIAKKMRQQL